MRHLTLDELLALQDGAELAVARNHLAECAVCTAERQLLEHRQAELRSLALMTPASDRWPAIRAAVRASRRRRTLGFAAALAAALAFAVLALSLVGKRRTAEVEPPDGLAELVQQSQRWEEKLRSTPEPEVLDIRSADTIVQLEDEIASVDQCIGELGENPSTRQELATLWQTRIALLETLASMRNPALAQLSF